MRGSRIKLAGSHGYSMIELVIVLFMVAAVVLEQMLGQLLFSKAGGDE